MRINEIISDDYDDGDDEIGEDKNSVAGEIIYQIKRYCGEYLLMNPDHLGTVLYRGRDLDDDYYMEENSPRNRKPVDMSQEFSNLLDKSFKLAGFETLRSNSIFCSGSASQAQQYGELCVVYPQDGFKFLYSDYFADLYTQKRLVFKNIYRPAFTNYEELDKKYNIEDLFYYKDNEKIDQLLREANFDTNVIKTNIQRIFHR